MRTRGQLIDLNSVREERDKAETLEFIRNAIHRRMAVVATFVDRPAPRLGAEKHLRIVEQLFKLRNAIKRWAAK